MRGPNVGADGLCHFFPRTERPSEGRLKATLRRNLALSMNLLERRCDEGAAREARGNDRCSGRYRDGDSSRGQNANRGGAQAGNTTRGHCVRGFGVTGPSILAWFDWLVAVELVLIDARSRDALQTKYDMRIRPGAHAPTQPTTSPCRNDMACLNTPTDYQGFLDQFQGRQIEFTEIMRAKNASCAADGLALRAGRKPGR
jgi:hypothetical protein